MEITLWLLIAMSDGYYNMGSVTVVDKFWQQHECETVRNQLLDGWGSRIKAKCIVARSFAPKKP